jgi:hypothetical protein
MPIFNRKRKERLPGSGQQAEKKVDRKCRRARSGHVRQKTEKCFVFDTDTVGRLRSFSAKKQTNKLELHFVLVALSLTQLLRAKEVFYPAGGADYSWNRVSAIYCRIYKTSLVRAVFFLRSG